MSVQPVEYQHPAPVVSARVVDMCLAVLIIAWTAEALGKLPVPPSGFAALIYAGFLARFAFYSSWLVVVALRHAWLLPFPVFCLLSTFWSPAPQATFLSALQLVFTVLAGVYLGQRFSVRELAMLAMIGLGLGIVASAAIWPLGLADTIAPGGGYQGVFLQKNGLGQRAAMFLILAMIVLPTARGWGCFAMILGGVIAVLMLLVSQSATAQIMAVAALSVGLIWQFCARNGSVRAITCVVATTTLGAGLATLLILNIDPVQALLTHFGKDPDLTGRLVLWEVAKIRVAEAPVLGHGYMAYWRAADFAQQVAVLRAVHGPTVGAFHNFALDVLVGLGAVGAATMLVFLGGVLRAMIGQGWCVMFFGVAVTLSLLGSSLYRPHEVVLLLLVALAISCLRDRPAP